MRWDSNFYSHASRKAWQLSLSETFAINTISTHTPLARRDRSHLRFLSAFHHFYSHASRKAWPMILAKEYRWPYISTHTPLARRDRLLKTDSNKYNISTHTPLARRDIDMLTMFDTFLHFYSHASRKAWRQHLVLQDIASHKIQEADIKQVFLLPSILPQFAKFSSEPSHFFQITAPSP